MNVLKKTIYGLIKKLKFLPPDLYVKIYYEYYSGKKLDLDNPIEFNQKISWLKVYYHPPILTQLVDKYSVRDYVKDKIGAQYLNELIDVYDSASEVDFEKLPDKFVIKGVHGYNFNLIVPEKSKLNKRKAYFLMRKWLRKNQYYRGGLEWAYKNVKPRLIAEKFLSEIGKKDLTDYKFFCFHGEPKFVQVDLDREVDHQRAFYDLDWNRVEFCDPIKVTQKEVPQPENFTEMIKLAKILSNKFPFVRVDFYSVNGKIIFGEMTFYPADGRYEFYPPEYNKIIGNYIKLPELPKHGIKEITAI
ncbi:ATP-grasp fold amidoligase family protein [Seonamhaeicola sp.]|uniref:ATP-grasp fold amidoligase family protein n=1 Tax=Seonamhaeicola sp. TaxID=1912245 RepID=UPI002615772C|nr:ATP-grasp fold amidoligase family protein [Seonamhaeicola sp.]